MTNSVAIDLIPGRECGGCTVCCKDLVITAPELKKPPGVLCRYADGNGCSIHDTRPAICRSWFCGWRALPELQLGDEWRPDRCGILISVTGKNIPAEFGPHALQFQIVGEPSDPFWHPVLSWGPLLDVLQRCAETRFPVFLAVPAPAGYYGKSFFLNHQFAAARSRDAIIEVLAKAYRAGMSAPKTKAEL